MLLTLKSIGNLWPKLSNPGRIRILLVTCSLCSVEFALPANVLAARKVTLQSTIQLADGADISGPVDKGSAELCKEETNTHFLGWTQSNYIIVGLPIAQTSCGAAWKFVDRDPEHRPRYRVLSIFPNGAIGARVTLEDTLLSLQVATSSGAVFVKRADRLESLDPKTLAPVANLQIGPNFDYMHAPLGGNDIALTFLNHATGERDVVFYDDHLASVYHSRLTVNDWVLVPTGERQVVFDRLTAPCKLTIFDANRPPRQLALTELPCEKPMGILSSGEILTPSSNHRFVRLYRRENGSTQDIKLQRRLHSIQLRQEVNGHDRQILFSAQRHPVLLGFIPIPWVKANTLIGILDVSSGKMATLMQLPLHGRFAIGPNGKELAILSGSQLQIYVLPPI